MLTRRCPLAIPANNARSKTASALRSRRASSDSEMARGKFGAP
jgi:hypothetical protein